MVGYVYIYIYIDREILCMWVYLKMEPPIPVGFHDFLYSLATNEGFTQFSDTPIYPMIF